MPTEPYITFGSPLIGQEEKDEVMRTLDSGWIGTGPRVARFEELFRDYIGCAHAIALNSCTAALHLALLAHEIGPGDEVITTPLTFPATANVIIHVGATPVFVDVSRTTMNIDPSRLQDAITPRTRAIIPVHLAGRPCDLDGINGIARRHGLIVIEDAAHCIEGWYHNRKIGTIGDCTCFSFYATKNMTTAEGGMLCTNDPDIARRVKMNALHGLSHDAWTRFRDTGYRHYEVMYPGFKYNMTDIAAALGIHQLNRLEPWLSRRDEIWASYDRAFSELPCGTPAPAEPDTRHARHLYTILIDPDDAGATRDHVMRQLHANGIGTGVHYRALHLHPYYRDRFGFAPDSFPDAAWISDRTLSLPLSARLTPQQVARVIAAVRTSLTILPKLHCMPNRIASPAPAGDPRPPTVPHFTAQKGP